MENPKPIDGTKQKKVVFAPLPGEEGYSSIHPGEEVEKHNAVHTLVTFASDGEVANKEVKEGEALKEKPVVKKAPDKIIALRRDALNMIASVNINTTTYLERLGLKEIEIRNLARGSGQTNEDADKAISVAKTALMINNSAKLVAANIEEKDKTDENKQRIYRVARAAEELLSVDEEYIAEYTKKANIVSDEALSLLHIPTVQQDIDHQNDNKQENPDSI